MVPKFLKGRWFWKAPLKLWMYSANFSCEKRLFEGGSCVWDAHTCKWLLWVPTDSFGYIATLQLGIALRITSNKFHKDFLLLFRFEQKHQGCSSGVRERRPTRFVQRWRGEFRTSLLFSPYKTQQPNGMMPQKAMLQWLVPRLVDKGRTHEEK